MPTTSSRGKAPVGGAAAAEGDLLLTVTITEGRGFPRRVGHSLVVEVKIGSEAPISSDPVPLDTHCVVNTDLSWETDRRAMEYFRLHRTPVRLTCYDVAGGAREELGYVILDIRQTLSGRLVLNTLPLLGRRAGMREKPEIVAGLRLERASEALTFDDAVKETVEQERERAERARRELAAERADKSGLGSSASKPAGAVAGDDAVVGRVTAPHFGHADFRRPIDSGRREESVRDDSESHTDAQTASVTEGLAGDERRHHDVGAEVESAEEGADATEGTEGTEERSAPPQSQPRGKESAHARSPAKPAALPARRAEREDDSASAETYTIDRHNEIFDPPITRHLHPEDPRTYHLRFAIDIRSARELNANVPLNVYFRYSYAFFGTSSPVFTHPPMELERGTERPVPNGFCAFEFTATSSQLRTYLNRVPLTVEMYHKDKYLRDVLLGIARISLASVFSSPLTTLDSGIGKQQTNDCYVSVCAFEEGGAVTKMAEIRVLLALQVLGVTGDPTAHAVPDRSSVPQAYASHPEAWGVPSTQQLPVGGVPGSIGMSRPRPDAPSSAPAGEAGGLASAVAEGITRDSPEYRAAVDLELWKASEEEKFMRRLADREATLLAALTEEFKRRDKEREDIVRKKSAEYEKLEGALRASLDELETRERALLRGEEDLRVQKERLQREFERDKDELRDASRRMQDDMVRKMEQERGRARDAERAKERLERDLRETEQRLAQVEADFATFRRQQSQRSETKLTEELRAARAELADVVQRLDATAKSKKHYKAQWARALREIAALRQRESAESEARLKRERAEVEQLRLRYLAREDIEAARGDREQLADILQQINSLKQADARAAPPSSSGRPSSPSKGTGRTAHSTATQRTTHTTGGHKGELTHDEAVVELQRLITEREALLRTGAYADGNPILVELDRRINALLGVTGGSA